MEGNFRSVLFKRYVQPLYDTDSGVTSIPQIGQSPLPNTGVYLENQQGFFHGWGYRSMELPDYVVQISVAIIEDTEGIIHLVEPQNFRFQIPLI